MRALSVVLVLCASACLAAGEVVLTDSKGRSARPLQRTGRRVTAYVFALSECPIANAYAPEIKRIAAKYGAQGVSISLVLVDPSLSQSKARQYAKDFGYDIPVLLDPKQKFSRLIGVSVSPEVAVYDKRMHLAYRGRIDDQYVALGRRRTVVRNHNLRDALNQVLAGKTVRPARTEAIGCTLTAPGR